LVVRATQEPEVLGIVRAVERSGIDVVELQEAASAAALSVLVHVGAHLLVSRPHLSHRRA